MHTVPLIVFYGDADDSVHSLDVQQIIQISPLLNGKPTDTRVSITTRFDREPGRHSCTQDVWRDQDGSLRAERWVVHGLGHAWSGGNNEGELSQGSVRVRVLSAAINLITNAGHVGVRLSRRRRVHVKAYLRIAAPRDHGLRRAFASGLHDGINSHCFASLT